MSGSSSDDWERRREARYQLLAEVRVAGADATPVLELGNLSRSGALVCFGDLPKPAWVRLGHTVEMDIINPDNLDTLEVTGEIVRVQEDADGHGFAVMFNDCDAAQTENIDDLIDIADRISALPPPPDPALAAPPSQRRTGPPPLPVGTGPPPGRTSGPPRFRSTRAPRQGAPVNRHRFPGVARATSTESVRAQNAQASWNSSMLIPRSVSPVVSPSLSVK